MWLFLSDAYFSIVSKDCARDEVLVRARRKGDIEKVFPGAKVREGIATDYQFRAAVKRDDLSKALAGEVARVTYSNFKDSITDPTLHEVASRVWANVLALEKARPGMAYASVFGSGQPTLFPRHNLGAGAPPQGKKRNRRKRRHSLRKGG